jgi:hypothetical protein
MARVVGVLIVTNVEPEGSDQRFSCPAEADASGPTSTIGASIGVPAVGLLSC